MHTPIYSLYRQMIIGNHLDIFKLLLPVMDFNHHYLHGETVLSYCIENYENDFLAEMYQHLDKNKVPYKDWNGGKLSGRDFLLNRIVMVGDYTSYVFLWLMDDSVSFNVGAVMESFSDKYMFEAKLQLMVYEIQKYGVKNKDIKSDFVRLLNSFEGPLDMHSHPQMRVVKASDWASVFAKVESERIAEVTCRNEKLDKKLKV